MIKLYVLTHKETFVPHSDALQLLRVDSTEKDNMADKTHYSELRAHYWVWKNEAPDISPVGFFHFRRYLDLRSSRIIPITQIRRQSPYYIKKWPRGEYYEESLLDSALSAYDIVAPLREYTGISVRKRYAEFSGHKSSDLDIIQDIVHEKYPEYSNAMETYLSGVYEYYGNIFVMRRDIFDSYCSWLFSILNEYSVRATDILPRTHGYLAERLFGVWFTYIQDAGNYRCAEAPRIHYWGFDDKNHGLLKAKVINIFLPPGSRIRSFVRKFLKRG